MSSILVVVCASALLVVCVSALLLMHQCSASCVCLCIVTCIANICALPFSVVLAVCASALLLALQIYVSSPSEVVCAFAYLCLNIASCVCIYIAILCVVGGGGHM